jgi:hypothetical protein
VQQQVIPTAPEVYTEAIFLETLPVILGLLSHENAGAVMIIQPSVVLIILLDIVVDALELLSDLTDPDVLNETEDPDTFLDKLVR